MADIDYTLLFDGIGPVEPEQAPREDAPRRRGLFRRLVDNLSQSRRALAGQIQAIAFDPADEQAWEDLETALIQADCGVPATVDIIERLEREAAAGRLTSGSDLGEAIAVIVAEKMSASQARIDVTRRPTVILVGGVNGTGKTTSIGKLAEHLRRCGKSVVHGAADTFRAPASEQPET